MPAPSIHLVCGSTGAGKTTYATELAERLAGVRFSIDDWMSALFWMDAPEPLDPVWSMARVERCNGQIWRTAADVAGRGVPCVLDLGFSTVEQRARFLRLAAEANLTVRLHYLEAPAQERWRRVLARNAQAGEAGRLPFAVTREMFDFVEGLFEAPTAEEMGAADGVRVTL